MQTMTERPQRQRSKNACQPCRQRKRKCDGHHPCSTCEQFEYDCYYNPRSKRPRLSERVPESTQSTPVPADKDNDPSSEPAERAPQLQPVEANSGAVFARTLGLGGDSSRVSPLRLFAWNLGLRSDTSTKWVDARPITALLDRNTMEELTMVYFREVHPVFGFLDQEWLEQCIAMRWGSQDSDLAHDAILCGVAALGCLFSGGSPTLEEQLCRSASMALDPSGMRARLHEKDVVGWLLRVIYFRLTAPPHAAWIAIGTMMHVLEAAGLHLEPSDDSNRSNTDLDSIQSRRRVYCVARYFNNWISFDYSRSRVEIRSATTRLPDADDRFCTEELLQIYLASEVLAPDRKKDSQDLEASFDQLCSITTVHQPMLILIHCNVIFCIYRRLRALGTHLTNRNIERILHFATKALDAAAELLESRRPWWHMPNMTFQTICALLAIDTPRSLSLLNRAVDLLHRIRDYYRTETMEEACSAAWELLYLHRKRKEQDIARLDEVLAANPGFPQDTAYFERTLAREGMQGPDMTNFLNGSPWSLSSSGWEQFLNVDLLPH